MVFPLRYLLLMNTIRKLLYLLILPVISGILLGISVPGSGVWFISFLAFIPLLFAAQKALSFKKSYLSFCLQLLIMLFVFYLLAGSWVLKAANLGFLIGILVVIPFLVLVPPYIFFIKRNKAFAPVYFIAAWMAAEFIQSYYPLGTPFYNLGNNPGVAPALIQWYEYTGSAGGSLWILAVNFLIYKVIFKIVNRKKVKPVILVTLLSVLLIPMIISVVIFKTYKEKGKVVKVMVVHPATDCYNMKYKTDIYELMNYYLDVIKSGLNEEIKYVVLPETAVTNGGWLHELEKNLVLDHFNLETIEYPDLSLVTGAVTYEAIDGVEKIKGYDKIPHIKYSERYKTCYFTYNTALQVEKKRKVQFRTKQELVPFQEYTPYPSILPRVMPVGIDFQFSAREKNQNIFKSAANNKVSAIICYESVYGKLYSEYSREGAEAFFEILNEGWYENTKGSQQFLNISVIRAIENRKDIARSSNMGISCFINQKGEVSNKIEGKKAGKIIEDMHFRKQGTFYSRIGDYLSIISLIVMIFLIGKEIVSTLIKNKDL